MKHIVALPMSWFPGVSRRLFRGRDQTYEDTTLVQPVGEVAASDHDNTGEDIRRRNEALTSTQGEAHSVEQNLREEVGKGVGDCGDAGEDGGKGPDLGVAAGGDPFLEVEGLEDDVSAVFVDARLDPFDLARLEEGDRVAVLHVVGEADEQDEAEKTNADRCGAFDNEQPSP